MQIPIITAFDDRFAIGAGVMMQSVLDTTSTPVRFVLLHRGVRAGNRQRLQQVIASHPHAEAEWIDVGEALSGLPTPLRSREFTQLIYARLLAETLLPDDRALYLDADTVVREDVAQLFQWDLRDRPLAAVSDIIAYRRSQLSRADRDYFRGITGGFACGDYFNSGVLLMDLNRMRRHEIGRRAIDFIHSGRLLKYPDQDALNHVLQGDYAPLPARWNAMVLSASFHGDTTVGPGLRRRADRALADPAVLHYAGPKPWTLFPTPLRGPFTAVLRRSPWRNHRIAWGDLVGRHSGALLKAWRAEAVSLRLRPSGVDIRLFGHRVMHWRKSDDTQAA